MQCCSPSSHSPPISPPETCELGPWSEWSTCTNKGRTCGCKWGLETRVRDVLGSPKEEEEEAAAGCPGLLESRKCRMRKHCPGGEGAGSRWAAGGQSGIAGRCLLHPCFRRMGRGGREHEG